MNKIHFLIPVVSMLFTFAVTQPVFGDADSADTRSMNERELQFSADPKMNENKELQFGSDAVTQDPAIKDANSELQFGSDAATKDASELRFGEDGKLMEPATPATDAPAAAQPNDSFQFSETPAMTHESNVPANETIQFSEPRNDKLSTEPAAPSDSFQFGDRMKNRMETNVPADTTNQHFEFGERRTTNEMVIPPSGMVRDQATTTTVVVDDDADEISDSDLEDQIEEAVNADKVLANEVSDFDVEVDDGVATLTGEATSDVVKANLVSKVMSVKGVVKVDDQLTVEAAK